MVQMIWAVWAREPGGRDGEIVGREGGNSKAAEDFAVAAETQPVKPNRVFGSTCDLTIE
jgi:hypothetical protein